MTERTEPRRNHLLRSGGSVTAADYEVSLQEVLRAREVRAERQKKLLKEKNCPVISFTLNIAGPVKADAAAEYAYSVGKERLRSGLSGMGFPVRGEEETREKTGFELLLSVEAEPEQLKRLCVSLEDLDGIGRLFDFDVLRLSGVPVQRSEVDRPERGCLVCGLTGRGCASRRIHPLEDIRTETLRRIQEQRIQTAADGIAGYSVQALTDEVCATPKPGLVDRENSGSHSDMDIFTFSASNAVLYPYFKDCFLLGERTAQSAAAEALIPLKAAGLEAERRMFLVTKGVNTHKGSIFTLGMLCAAAGRCFPADCFSPPDLILWFQTAAELAAAAGDGERNSRGAQLRNRYGPMGPVEELKAGLPSVREISLPALVTAKEYGLNLNDTCVYVLLRLIAETEDTNMIARGGMAEAQKAKTKVQELLTRSETLLPGRTELNRLDLYFTERNLSPGGCADLLEATLLIARWINLLQ